jgi:hypothetical protein
MKTLLTLSLALLCLNAKAQQTEKFKLPLSSDSTIVYEKVIPLDSTYKSAILYKAAKTWFVNNFKSSKAVIQSEDQINGRFLGKCYITGTGGLSYTVFIGDQCYFTIQIDIKDGKYRYRFYDFYGTGEALGSQLNINESRNYCMYLNDKIKGGFVGRDKMYKRLYSFYSIFDTQINSLITSLNTAMINSKKDDF